jgi:hypothetical protein
VVTLAPRGAPYENRRQHCRTRGEKGCKRQRQEQRKDRNHPTHNGVPGSGKRGRIENLKPWPKGVSDNPSGRAKHDIAAEIARAVFEHNAEALYYAYSKAALKGNAYAFKELADRAYGKLKERHEVEVGPYREMTEEQLLQRIKQLEQQELGITREAPALLPPIDDLKPN